MNTRKIALWGAGIVALSVLIYGGVWLYKRSKTMSGNAQKDNRNIQIKRA